MEHIVRTRLCRIIINSVRLKYNTWQRTTRRNINTTSTLTSIHYRASPLLLKRLHSPHKFGQRRYYGMFVVRAVRSVLKLRYLFLGGAVAGGSALNQRYNEWRDGLPDMKWVSDVLPGNGKWEEWRGSLIDFTDNMKNSVELDPRLKTLAESKYGELKDWFDKRLDDAIAAAEDTTPNNNDNNKKKSLPALSSNQSDGASFAVITHYLDRLYSAIANKTVVHAKLFGSTTTEDATSGGRKQTNLDEIHGEMMQTQIKYQRELERLERENKELRKQNLLLKEGRKPPMRKVRRSLIDMYSEVLDELADFDSGYNTQDQLPRVVVVGDQSSGKTSVLEMIAQARIFPRGAGEMMTRAPVKVTLSEGPYHVAQFRDSTREFDLGKEDDLVELRREVELRMRNSVRGGKTVSNEVISMTVKGPGLQRMVLVDLPGIISTVTVDMASDTRDCIKQMTQTYMNNPNAIILCIQDGSVDAERSNVTDLVAQCDPQGKRTIFVLTKVDMAEENLTDPNRIRRILSGKLFPMKALGYFAVVTGRGRKDDSIQTIKEYEEKFFQSSKLFKDGVIRSTQVTTRNLSLAVADCFWKMVRESVEQQADAFKARRFNLESEWKNSFPRTRELDRDELFERARADILDKVVNLSQESSQRWDTLLMDKVWDKVSHHILDTVLLEAAQNDNKEAFDTAIDIKLRQWAEQSLPAQSIECGWDTLMSQFEQLMLSDLSKPNHDDIFDKLKEAVVQEVTQSHIWEDKALHRLCAIQIDALEDRDITRKKDWEDAVKFLEASITEKLNETDQLVNKIGGPSFTERWLYWKSQTSDDLMRSAVKSELDKILMVEKKRPSILSYDELTTIRNNLLRDKAVEVDNDFIRDIWHPLYKHHFYNQCLIKARDCRRLYHLYNQQTQTVDCSEVLLFHRIHQVMTATTVALRQQIINREIRRLDKEIKEILEDYSQDNDIKEKLLTGRRVTLAEELKRVRQIQERLEEFIKALSKEK